VIFLATHKKPLHKATLHPTEPISPLLPETTVHCIVCCIVAEYGSDNAIFISLGQIVNQIAFSSTICSINPFSQAQTVHSSGTSFYHLLDNISD